MITDYNSLKKQIIYRFSYSGTKETDILYKKLILDKMNTYKNNELKLLSSLILNYSDPDLFLILTNKMKTDIKYNKLIKKILND